MQTMIANYLQASGALRTQALMLLTDLVDEDVTDVIDGLIDAFETTPSPKYRAELLVFFGTSGHAAFAPFVERALRDDPDKRVRAYAAVACIAYPQLAGALLWAQSMDTSGRVRKAAAETYKALDEMGEIAHDQN